MRVRKIVLGLAAVASAAVLAACSSGSSGASGSSGNQAVAAAANSTSISSTPAKSSTSDAMPSSSSSTAAPSTTTPATSTSQAPATTPVATKPAANVPAAPSTPGVPCSASARACVDLSARKAWLMQNGQVVFGPVSIMPGSPSFPTPTGTFHVLAKNASYRSREFHNALMPDAVFFYPGDAFHVGSLGVFSHGCIHLSWGSAAQFFKTLQIGDEVQVVR